MFATIGHTFQLIGASWRVLMKDKELIFFPIMSGVGLLLLLVGFYAIGSATGTIDRVTAENAETENVDLVLGGLLFFLAYFTVIFFNAALISAAQERLRGGDPNVRSGLTHALAHLPAIIGWAVIAAVVGALLAYLRSRSRGNMAGRIGTGLLSQGWSMITFFVIPILVTEGVGPIEAMKRSAGLFTKTWGRQLTANFGFGIIYIAAMFVVGAVSGLFFAISPIIGIPVAVLLFGLVIGTVQALEGIFKAALYDYARGEKPLEFAEADLRYAYAPAPAPA